MQWERQNLNELPFLVVDPFHNHSQCVKMFNPETTLQTILQFVLPLKHTTIYLYKIYLKK